MIQFVAIPVTLDAAAGEDSPRTITGVAVPWDTPATVSSGESVMFKRGAFDVNAKAPKLIEGHDMTQLRGVVTELVEAEEGLLFTAKFAKTRASDEAIELVKAGAYDSVSVGAIPVSYKYDKNGTMVVSKANLVEISLVAQPAFADAVITEIAASQPEEEEAVEPQPNDIPEEETMSQETPAVEASAEIVPTAPIVFAQAKKTVALPTAAEYIAAAIAGGDAWLEMSAALKAAAPDVVTTDTPGILPIPIVGPVYNNFVGRRPVVDAVGVKAMPGGGKVFIRPEVTTHTSMAAQSSENAALQSGTYVVYNNQVTKGTYGGYVSISNQDLEWTDPAVLSLILDDMGRIYANTTDNVAADALASGATTTQNFTAADTDQPASWSAGIAAAAATILSASNGNLPTHLFLAPGIWQDLLALADSSGRPLFPQIGPMNAFGNLQPGQPNGTAFGLQVVVDRNFASGTAIVGDATGFEIFEQQKGALSIESPSTLSRTLSWHGYFATLMIDPSKFVKFAFV
jgi:HK97 family phage prohead protease